MKISNAFIFIFTIGSLILAACKATATATSTALPLVSPTPDLCSAQILPSEVGKVNQKMREFDDISRLAGTLPQNSLYQAVSDLQRVRRDAEDQSTPPCLQELKKYQLAHMNAVINTLIAFMGGASPDDLNQGISSSRQLHDQYTVEMARLLGLTLVVPPTSTPGAAASALPGTPVIQVTQATLPIVSNPGPNTINIRTQPALDAPTLGALGIGLTANASGKTADEQWILIEVPGTPGQLGWVYAPLIQLSVPAANLPVTTPVP